MLVRMLDLWMLGNKTSAILAECHFSSSEKQSKHGDVLPAGMRVVIISWRLFLRRSLDSEKTPITTTTINWGRTLLSTTKTAAVAAADLRRRRANKCERHLPYCGTCVC